MFASKEFIHKRNSTETIRETSPSTVKIGLERTSLLLKALKLIRAPTILL